MTVTMLLLSSLFSSLASLAELTCLLAYNVLELFPTDGGNRVLSCFCSVPRADGVLGLSRCLMLRCLSLCFDLCNVSVTTSGSV
jgi:hypothetical protein